MQRGAITVIIVSVLIIIGIAQLPKNEKADSEAAPENPPARYLTDSGPVSSPFWTDALFRAAVNGTASEVKAALSAGADPNARDGSNWTPLHRAAIHRRNPSPSVITALIDGGADPGARDDADLTPLSRALLAEANPSVIAAFIEGGTDPNERNGTAEFTPLHVATYNPAVIAMLIEAGADPNSRMKNGETVLHGAATRPFAAIPAVITALIEAGADPNSRAKDTGRTPLHEAALWSDNLAVIAALIDGGADPDSRDSFGDTPLQLAGKRSKDRLNPYVIEALKELSQE